jgi:methylamine utilization protein MauE
MAVAGALAGALCDCAAVLLLASGPAKLRAPDAVGALLTELNLPGWRRGRHRVLARAIGAAEIAIGGYVLVRGDRLSTLLLALAYFAFAVVAARAVSVRSTASCGCFGAASAPVGRVHLAVTLGCLAAAAAGTVAGAGPLTRHFDAGPGAGFASLLLIAVLAAALYLLITVLPVLLTQLRAGSE